MGEEKEKPKEKEKDPPKKEEKDKKKEEENKETKKEEKEKKEEIEKEKKKEDEKDLGKDSKQKDGKESNKDHKDGKPGTPSSSKNEKRKDDEKSSRKKLKKGMVVKTAKHEFKIDKILGSGGFGDVYKVSLVQNENEVYAMKTEYDDPKKKKMFNRLKIETVTLEDLNSPANKKDCFVKLIDKGTTPQFRFIVMDLVSYSLYFILKEIVKGPLPDHSATYLMKETLTAITTLHSIGYIHRDIKPHNFAVGLGSSERRVFLLDFGIARKYLDEKKQFIVPRQRVQFLGTLKYCSRACHLEKEQAIKDDLECWAYMCLEFYADLTWSKKKDRDEILKMKTQLFASAKGNKGPWGPTRWFYAEVLKQIDKMSLTDDVSKTIIQSLVNNALKEIRVETKTDDKTPLVWEGKTMPDSKPRKKATVNRVQNDEDSSERREREDREKRRKYARIREIETELMKMMKDIDDRDEPEDRKEEARRRARDRRRRSTENEKRRSGRKKRGPTIDDESYDDDDDYDDDEDDSYDDHRRRSSNHRRRQRDDESRMRKRDSRKPRSNRTRDDQKDRRKSRKSETQTRKKSTKARSLRRRNQHSTQEEKLVKLIDDSPKKEKVRGSGKRSSAEKEASAEKMDEKDGERKGGGSKDGTPQGSREGEKMSMEPSPSATPIEGSDKAKKK